MARLRGRSRSVSPLDGVSQVLTDSPFVDRHGWVPFSPLDFVVAERRLERAVCLEPRLLPLLNKNGWDYDGELAFPPTTSPAPAETLEQPSATTASFARSSSQSSQVPSLKATPVKTFTRPLSTEPSPSPIATPSWLRTSSSTPADSLASTSAPGCAAR